jgi:hypothetical protein
MSGLYAANLAEMRGKVRDWADTAVISDGVIDDFINIAIGRMARLVRVRQMEFNDQIVHNGQGITIPTDYLETKSLKLLSASQPIYLETKSLDFVEELKWSSAGDPLYFAKKTTAGGQQLLVTAPSGVGLVFELIYWREPPTLIADTDSNWFLTNNATGVLYGALVELGVYITDEEFAAMYESKFSQALMEIQAIDDKASWSGDTLSVNPEA